MPILHVSPSGSDNAAGTAEQPLRTINRAAQLARPGDTVQVHEGVYREWVAPTHGGLSENRRITFESAPGERAVIKGSEQITGWEQVAGDVWQVRVNNALFGDWNPFAIAVSGDWLVRPAPSESQIHLGAIFVDGVAGYEVATRDEVGTLPRRTDVLDDWTGTTVPVTDPDATTLQWHAEVGAEQTLLTASFPGVDPQQSLIEITVRKSVFWPTEHHIDYLTVRGFELCHSATEWAPPTAEQPGLIGPNWAKGWVIEDNHIHHASCSAVSLGKERSSGQNFATVRGDKPGYQYQLESVFSATRIGWNQDLIGSHVVRRNRIHDCGQNGIVGHLGCIFSTISDNDISRVGTKRQYYGHEIAGIKLHAPIDVRIEHNRLHHCSLGLWLDWQTQGTRITRNVMHDNARDLFIEVSHGPYVVDHNVLTSPEAIENRSQGGAYVANLIGGTLQVEAVVDRATPYHLPHSTEVAGFTPIHVGDDRFVGNLFLADPERTAFHPDKYSGGVRPACGTAIYDGHPTSLADYLAGLVDDSRQDHTRFAGVAQPVTIVGNVYAPGNTPFEGETDPTVLAEPVPWSLRAEGEELYLELDPSPLLGSALGVVDAGDFDRVRIVGADFDEADGSPVDLRTDLLGTVRDKGSAAGPIADLSAGPQSIRIW